MSHQKRLRPKLYMKLTQRSTVEIEKCTIRKSNEIGHGMRFKHWIIFDVWTREVRSDSDTGAGGRICGDNEGRGGPPVGFTDQLMTSNQKWKKDEYWVDWTSEPPQKIMVAVQLFAGVRGNIIVAALAGYVLTASGMLSSGVSTLVLMSSKTVSQFDWIKSCPEGKSQVRGKRLAGRVFWRIGDVMRAPLEGKNS